MTELNLDLQLVPLDRVAANRARLTDSGSAPRAVRTSQRQLSSANRFSGLVSKNRLVGHCPFPSRWRTVSRLTIYRQRNYRKFRIYRYWLYGSPMVKPPEKKPDPSKPPALRVLPMQLQVGDQCTDETGEYEVIGRPYTTARVGQERTFASRSRVRGDDDPSVGRARLPFGPHGSKVSRGATVARARGLSIWVGSSADPENAPPTSVRRHERATRSRVIP